MGKMTKMDKHRIARDKARRDAPFREMEELARDKNVSDEALMHNYTRVFTLAVRQKKFSEAMRYGNILASYYRDYDMHSRLLSLQNHMVNVERQLSSQTRSRIADKIRAKMGPKRVKKTVAVVSDKGEE